MCACMCVCLHIGICENMCPWRPEASSRSPAPEVTHGCELPNIDAGNQYPLLTTKPSLWS